MCSITYSMINGVTSSINTTIDEFKKRGIETLILSPEYGVTLRKEHVKAPSSLVQGSIISLMGKEERMFSFKALKTIKEIDRKFNPDAYWLHTITWKSNPFENYIVTKNKPKVLTYHTLVEDYGKVYAGTIGGLTMRFRSESVCSKMNEIISPSLFIKNKLIGYGVKKPITVIPTGVKISKNSFSKEEVCSHFKINVNAKILLYVGRIFKEKNIESILRAAKDLKKTNYCFVVLFIGSGNIQEMTEKAKKMNVNDVVIFTGPLPKEETDKIYKACDAFVFASQTETQGLVIGEAMMSNLPVIALDSPIREEVYPEGTAVIVKNEKNFANDIIKTLSCNKRRNLMIQKANTFASNKFSVKKMAEKQIKIFENLVIKNNR